MNNPGFVCIVYWAVEVYVPHVSGTRSPEAIVNIRVLVVALSLVLSVPASWTQNDKANWDNLKQIRPGQRIQVVETNLRSTTGKFVRVSDSEIALQVDRSELTVPRDKVFRVSEDHRRGRNALYAAFVGAGIGAGLGAVASRDFDDPGEKAGIVVLVSGSWAGIFAGVSALVTRNPTVYRLEPGKQPASSTPAKSASR